VGNWYFFFLCLVNQIKILRVFLSFQKVKNLLKLNSGNLILFFFLCLVNRIKIIKVFLSPQKVKNILEPNSPCSFNYLYILHCTLGNIEAITLVELVSNFPPIRTLCFFFLSLFYYLYLVPFSLYVPTPIAINWSYFFSPVLYVCKQESVSWCWLTKYLDSNNLSTMAFSNFKGYIASVIINSTKVG
jgi:hypothetical protein